MVRAIDSRTGELVPGCAVRVRKAGSGEDFTAAVDQATGYFSGEVREAGSLPGDAAREAPWGEYLVDVEAPEGYAAPVSPTPFTFSEDSSGYVDVFLEPQDTAADEESDASEGRFPVGKAGDAGARRRTAAHLAFLALAAAAVAVAVVIAGPSLYVASYALASIFNPALGLGFCAGLLGLLASAPGAFGPGKAFALIGALGASPVLLAFSAAACAALLAWALRRLSRAMEAKAASPCPLLDNRPPAAKGCVHGDADIERSARAIRSELPNCAADGSEEVPQGRFFVGVVDGPLPLAALETARTLAGKAAGRLAAKIPGKAAREGNGLFEAPSPPRSRNAMRYVYTPDFQNGILLGDTRAGKTRRILLATVHMMLLSRTSVVIIDPKGEIYGTTSGLAAEAYGAGRVFKVDFRDPDDSDRKNPLQFVIAASLGVGTRERERDSAGRVLGDYSAISTAVADMAKMLLPEMNDVGNGKYFNQGGRSCISSAAAYVCSPASGCPDGQMSLAAVASLIDRYMRPRPKPGGKAGEMWCPYKAMLSRLPHDHPAAISFGTAGSAKDSELAAFVTTALTALQDYRDRGIARVTSADDFRFEELGRTPTVVYLVIPHEKQTYAAIASLYLQQAYQALIAEATRQGGTLAVKTTFLCEELGQLPPVPDLDGKLTVSLGSGINWLLVFQSLSQLVSKYETAPATTIWANANFKMLLKTADTKITGEWVRDQLGTYTAATTSSSRSRDPFSPFASSLSDSSQLAKRDVLMPHEVASWTADVGNLLMLNYAGLKRAYCVDLPDVSRTPTGAALGLDGPGRPKGPALRPRAFAEAQAWDPCLGTMEPSSRYSEEEFARMSAEFEASLLALLKKAQNPAAAKKPEPAVAYVAKDGSAIAGPFPLPADKAEAAACVERLRRDHPCGDGGPFFEVGEVTRGGEHVGWEDSPDVRRKAERRLANFVAARPAAEQTGDAPDAAEPEEDARAQDRRGAPADVGGHAEPSASPRDEGSKNRPRKGGGKAKKKAAQAGKRPGPKAESPAEDRAEKGRGGAGALSLRN